MNCQEFARHPEALTNSRLMDAATQKAAFRHAEECARCAALLSQEKALRAAFSATAQAETEQAPAHLKTSLMAAFAAQYAAPVAVAPVVSIAAWRTRQARWWLAAAATLAVAAFLGGAAQHRWATPTSLIAVVPSPAPARPFVAPAVPAVPPQVTDKPQVTSMARTSFKVVGKQPNVPQRNLPVRHYPRRDAVTVAAKPTESVTEYISLTYVAAPDEQESGQVVRITMPRSSAVALGLPPYIERQQETIKADVVMGDDGLARQIRFVYQPDADTKGNRRLK